MAQSNQEEYIMFDYRPPFCYGGGHFFNAFRTHGKPWESVVELLPTEVCNYELVEASSKSDAVRLAKRRWAS